MDKEQAEKHANKLLTEYGKSDEERWRGFTAVIATYGGTSDLGPHTTLSKDAAAQIFNRLTKEKPPATINGVKFAMRSIAWIETTPTSGKIEAEYVRAEEGYSADR